MVHKSISIFEKSICFFFSNSHVIRCFEHLQWDLIQHLGLINQIQWRHILLEYSDHCHQVAQSEFQSNDQLWMWHPMDEKVKWPCGLRSYSQELPKMFSSVFLSHGIAKSSWPHVGYIDINFIYCPGLLPVSMASCYTSDHVMIGPFDLLYVWTTCVCVCGRVSVCF